MRDIQLYKHFGSTLIEGSVEILIEGHESTYGVGYTSKYVFGSEGKRQGR